MKYAVLLLWTVTFVSARIKQSAKDLEGQLYEDLLFDYNKIPRPVKNSSDILTVDVGASLIRIIDVVCLGFNHWRLRAIPLFICKISRMRKIKCSQQTCGLKW